TVKDAEDGSTAGAEGLAVPTSGLLRRGDFLPSSCDQSGANKNVDADVEQNMVGELPRPGDTCPGDTMQIDEQGQDEVAAGSG
ncbi:unnamed protein product, partial [Amoebophrya sp. A25]